MVVYAVFPSTMHAKVIRTVDGPALIAEHSTGTDESHGMPPFKVTAGSAGARV